MNLAQLKNGFLYVLILGGILAATTPSALARDVALERLLEAQEKAALFCTMDHIPEAKRWVESQVNTFDKFKHCAVSCFLTLRCNSREVMLVGLLKEFKDAVGPGNAEVADLVADRYGIRLVTKKKAFYDADCVRLCNAAYPMPAI